MKSAQSFLSLRDPGCEQPGLPKANEEFSFELLRAQDSGASAGRYGHTLRSYMLLVG